MKIDLGPSILIAEQARLVARGVRSCALVGHCAAQRLPMLRAMTVLGTANCAGSIPFVVDRGDGNADCGFAAGKWAIDLYRYAIREAPDRQRHRIIGLLLGYSAQAIYSFEELNDAMCVDYTLVHGRRQQHQHSGPKPSRVRRSQPISRTHQLIRR